MVLQLLNDFRRKDHMIQRHSFFLLHFIRHPLYKLYKIFILIYYLNIYFQKASFL